MSSHSLNSPVEDHVDPLVGDSRINDSPFAARLDLDSHLVALVLVGNQRSDVRLDTASTKSNNDNGSCKAAEGRAALNSRRQSSCPQDEQADPVDGCEDQDSLVSAEILVGNDGTENRRDCTSSQPLAVARKIKQ